VGVGFAPTLIADVEIGDHLTFNFTFGTGAAPFQRGRSR